MEPVKKAGAELLDQSPKDDHDAERENQILERGNSKRFRLSFFGGFSCWIAAGRARAIRSCFLRFGVVIGSGIARLAPIWVDSRF